MKAVAQKVRYAASPLVLAVALGMLSPNVLLDDEGDVTAEGGAEGGARADDGGAADLGFDLAATVGVEG